MAWHNNSLGLEMTTVAEDFQEVGLAKWLLP